jgi:diaminopimelate decarboxylase
MASPLFVSPEQAFTLRANFGTPLYVYDEKTLSEQADKVLAFPNAFGLTGRYAMKALPSAAVLRLFHKKGLHIDASSGFEAERAMKAGIPAENIMITAQELPVNLKELVSRGCLFNACSLHQLEIYGQLFPGTGLSIRVNPGLGSGHSNRTNVGGPSSSFGIWHEHTDKALAIAAKHALSITMMHTHFGSGADPEVWMHCARLALGIAARLPEVTRLSLGGGFKVARMDNESGADLHEIGTHLLPAFEAFEKEHGRRLHLEVEPGTFLVAHGGALLVSVMDLVETGEEGYRFMKTDGGMTEILRPSLYGAQHPITLMPSTERGAEKGEYLVVGHCCESGDILTPEPGNSEGLLPRSFLRPEIGDILYVGGAGAYCAGMAAKNYNSFPEAAEVMICKDGKVKLIRRRQTLDQMIQNEIADGE